VKPSPSLSSGENIQRNNVPISPSITISLLPPLVGEDHLRLLTLLQY